MDVNNVRATLAKMFPGLKLNEAFSAAEQMMRGTQNSLDGARATAQKIGITPQAVNDIYNRFGKTMQGRAICGLLGTTPEALKADADMIVGGVQAPVKRTQNTAQSATRFPRLK